MRFHLTPGAFSSPVPPTWKGVSTPLPDSSRRADGNQRWGGAYLPTSIPIVPIHLSTPACIMLPYSAQVMVYVGWLTRETGDPASPKGSIEPTGLFRT